MSGPRFGRIRIGALTCPSRTSAQPPHAPAVVNPTSSAAAASACTTPVDGLRGGDTGAISSWSIQTALQVAYPPLPLVVGIRDIPWRWPVANPLVRGHVSTVTVPEHTSLNATVSDVVVARSEKTASGTQRLQSVFEQEVECAEARQPGGRPRRRLMLMLRDVATLPWSAGSTLTTALSRVAQVRRGADVSHFERHASTTTGAAALAPHLQLPSTLPRPAADDQHETHHESGHHHTEALSWSTSCEYLGPQPCAEASAVSLRSFAAVQQQQQHQRPMVVFVAERSWSCGDDDGNAVARDPAGTLEPTPTAAVRGTPSCLPDWVPATVPVHTLPVEVYAERAPLLHVGGTAALQLRFRQLRAPQVQGAKEEAVKTSSRGTASHDAGAWLPPAGDHLVWNGHFWAAETDGQLVGLEEDLLTALASAPAPSSDAGSSPPPPHQRQRQQQHHHHPHRVSPVRRIPGAQLRRRVWPTETTVTPPRLWLPGRWPVYGSVARSRVLSLQLPPDGDFAEKAVADGRPPSHRSVVSASSTCSAAFFPRHCTQWVMRLRKHWVVCGLEDGVRLHSDRDATHPPVHDENCPASARRTGPYVTPAHGSCSRYTAGMRQWRGGAVEAARLRYPNYNLMSGAPLELDELRCRHTDTHRRHSRRRCRTAPDAAAEAAEAAAPSAMPEMPETQQPHRNHSIQAAMEVSTDNPLLCAVLSRQVAWVPLNARTDSGTGSCSSTCAPGSTTTTTTWELPEALRVCYDLPSSAAQVPQPALCTPAAATTAASTCGTTHSAAHPAAARFLPLPPACLSVPQQEWWTGFFLHDAPAWWRHEVGSPSTPQSSAPPHAAPPAAGVRRSDPHSGAACNELEALLTALCADCGVPPLPVDAGDVRAALDWLCAAPALTANTAAAAAAASSGTSVLSPRVCLLHLAPVAPAVCGTARSNPFTSDACLQWTVVPATAAITVNNFFSLGDVVRVSSADGASVPQTPPVLLFIEVKAALAVLLRRQQRRAAVLPDADGVCLPRGEARADVPPPPSWWDRLSAFHIANSFAVDGAGRFTAAQDDEAGGASHGRDSSSAVGDGEEEGEGDIGTGGRAGAVSALSHPSVADLVYACVSMMLQPTPAPLPYDAGPPCEIGAAAAVASWTRTTYDALLKCALGLADPATASASAATNYSAAGSDDTEEGSRNDSGGSPASHTAAEKLGEAVESAGMRVAAAACDESADGEGDAAVGTETQLDESPPADGADADTALLSLPHGTAVRRYDEDGTRCADTIATAVAADVVDDDDMWRDDRLQSSRRDVHRAPRHHRRLRTLGAHRRSSESSLLRSVDTEGSLAFAVLGAGAVAETSTTTTTRPTVLDPSVTNSIAAARKEHRRHATSDELEGNSGSSLGDGGDGMDDKDLADADGQHGASVARQCGLRHGVLLDATLLRLYQTPGWVRTEAAAGAVVQHPPAFLERLVMKERRGFVRGWYRLLKYLPRRTSATTAHGGRGSSLTSSSSSAPLHSASEHDRVDLLDLFPFLQPSAAEEHCVRVGNPCHATTSALSASCDNGAVVVSDIGLCVLHFQRTDVYVNAANLLYHE